MEKHPFEGIMSTTLESIRDMIDVNTIVGDAITTADGSTVVPVSRVSFGFVAGGGEYALNAKNHSAESPAGALPFAGGTGAGVTVQPLGFLVTGPDSVRLLPAQPYAPVDRIIELVPQTLCEIKNALSSCMERKKAAAQEPPAAPQE